MDVPPLIWQEVSTIESDKAREFYAKLFEWSSTDVPMGPGGTYTLFQQSNRQISGIVRVGGEEWDGLPPRWSVYVHVEDVEASANKARELGGEVCIPPFDIPNVGRACIAMDPGGASFYLFQPKSVQI